MPLQMRNAKFEMRNEGKPYGFELNGKSSISKLKQTVKIILMGLMEVPLKQDKIAV